jgi:hypothetical protein
MLSSRPLNRNRRPFDPAKITALLDKVLADIGPERFSQMGLLEAEKFVRGYDKANELPAETGLRAAINSYRAAKWPGCAPKRLNDRFRR